jgi:SAM-dependent methyltransferase
LQPEAYRLMAELEAEHWWYRGRRALVGRLLERLELGSGARLLEVGAGTGGNLDLLARFGEVWGVEPSAVGAALGRRQWAGRVLRARAAELPFRDRSFDVVAALDVLEHLHDDLAALDEFRRVLRPGGFVVLHVPAYRALWGHEDVVSGHLRRYRAREVGRLLAAAGLEAVHLGYANALLLPVVAPIKVAKRLWFGTGRPRPDIARLPPAPLNRFLTALVEAEAEVAAASELPFGVSVLAAARRP